MEHLWDTLNSSSKDCSDRFQLWTKILQNIAPETVTEIGVWKGAFAAHLLKHTNSIRTYYMIDPWQHLPDWNKPANVEESAFSEIYQQAMEATAFARSKVKVLRDQTKNAVRKIPDQCVDFVYVDGDHTLRGITIDLLSIWPKVKPGGFIGGDDFSPDIWQHRTNYEPTLVFPFAVYFAEAVHATIYGLPCQQFLIQKPTEKSDFQFITLAGGYEEQSLLNQMTRLNRRRWRSVLPDPIQRVARHIRATINGS